MLPLIPLVVSRAGWVAAGVVLGALAKSEIGKEAVQMFKDGINGMGEDYRRDMSAKDKADLAEKERLVRDIRSGKQ